MRIRRPDTIASLVALDLGTPKPVEKRADQVASPGKTKHKNKGGAGASGSLAGVAAGFSGKLGRIGAFIGAGMLLIGGALGKPPLVTPHEPTPCTMVAEAGASRCTTGNDLKLLIDGGEIRQGLLSHINGAQKSLWLNVYEFQNDATANEIADALIAAKQRGVDVRMVVDNRHGSGDPAAVLGENVRRMRAAGIEVHQPSYGGYAVNHRKILVADGERAIVSGANIGGSYLHPKENGWSYHDAAMTMAGPAVQDVAAVFIQSFRDAGGGRLELPARPEARSGTEAVQIVSHKGGADRNIEREYIQRIEASASRIVLVNGFSMSEDIRDALKRAESRGVQVTWLWGRASADTAVMAEKGLNELIAAGAEVHQVPWALHMKAAMFDDEHVILGSANLDGFSMHRNDEVVVQVSSKEFAREMIERVVAPDLQASVKMSAAGGNTTGDAKRDFALRYLLEPLVN